ncbi:MAG: septal ring lytic transglycosylase RlpA family protein, partial [Luteimonas sp.]
MIRFGLRFALIALCSGSLLIACAGAPKKTAAPTASTRATSPPQDRGTQAQTRSPYAPAQEDPGKRGNYTRGGLYAPEVQDSAPGDLPDVDAIPEPVVRVEPRSPYGNRSPYVVLGKSYAVLPSSEGYIERGLASFYGNKFHGRRTSNLEVYDMYAFTAAHKTLPLPSFARVTNVANGKSVIVRVNDRGPFHDGRIIDLSYAAAVKLGVQRAGTAMVEVRGLSAGENAREPDDTVADAASVQNGVLPPGVRIATGRPQPAPGANSSTNGGSASVGSPRAGSAIDTLVAALPVASASAGE